MLPAILTTLFVALAACGGNGTASGDMTDNAESQNIAEIVAKYRETIMLPGVVGVGESSCDGRPCIKIYLASADDELEQQLPSELDGVPVVIQISGEFRAN